MARISNYNQDTGVQGNDRLIGTSSDGTTKTYGLDTIGNYFIENNVISVSGQQNFKFVTSVNEIQNGTFFIQGNVSDGASLSSISNLSICKTNTQGKDVEIFLRAIFSDKFKLSSVSQPNSFSDFRTDSITQDPSNASFLKITFSYVEGSGSLSAREIFAFTQVVQTDLKFTHSQNQNSNEWAIQHNLNKHPSVTIVDSGDNIVHAEVEYINLNNLIIRFNSANSGKAYLN